MYYDENIHTRSARTPEKLDAMLAECYRIAERDNDKEFKDYLEITSLQQLQMQVMQ